jgi:hypothetical protein
MGRMDGSNLGDRVTALELAVRSLSREDLARFAEVVREASTGAHEWPPNQRFWFDGTADLKFSRDDDSTVRELWTRMNAALVYVVTGEEDFGSDREQIEGRAATVLENAIGGDVWLGTIGIWNALCAYLLQGRLDSSLRDDLASSWQKVGPSSPLVR